MSKLLKSMIRFSWAMPLFGMRQMGNMLVRSDSAAKGFDTVADAIQAELDPSTKIIFGSDKAQAVMTKPLPDTRVRRQIGEDVIVTTSRGSGTVRHGIDGRTYFIVDGSLEGIECGEFEGVWSATVFTPQDLVSYPPQALAPFDRPFKPVEKGWNPPLNFTKAKWTLDGGWLEATGPALSRIQIQSDGQTQFWYSVAAFVTGGGGVYEGIRGQATSMGSAHFAAPPQPSEALSFDLHIVHVLNIARHR